MASPPKNRWLPLEANPEVINAYCKILGGPSNVQFVDVLSTDDWALQMVVPPVLSLLLLFPIKSAVETLDKEQRGAPSNKGQNVDENVWFTRQTIANACGTIAILHALTNLVDGKNYTFEDGKWFSQFYYQCQSRSPEERAKLLENDTAIETAHRHTVMQGQSSVPSESDKVDFHFITFTLKMGNIYELDGRKQFPINHGPSTPETFLPDAIRVVKEHFMSLHPGELRFQILAVTAT